MCTCRARAGRECQRARAPPMTPPHPPTPYLCRRWATRRRLPPRPRSTRRCVFVSLGVWGVCVCRVCVGGVGGRWEAAARARGRGVAMRAPHSLAPPFPHTHHPPPPPPLVVTARTTSSMRSHARRSSGERWAVRAAARAAGQPGARGGERGVGHVCESVPAAAPLRARPHARARTHTHALHCAAAAADRRPNLCPDLRTPPSHHTHTLDPPLPVRARSRWAPRLSFQDGGAAPGGH